MEKQDKVYVWVEYNKSSIPSEIEDFIIVYSQSFDEEKNPNIVMETRNSYFVRIPGVYKNNEYSFNFFTAGWENISYRLFLEISPVSETKLINIEKSGFSFELEEKYCLGLITPENFCLIKNTFFSSSVESDDLSKSIYLFIVDSIEYEDESDDYEDEPEE